MRAASSSPFSRILAAVDGSEGAMRAAEVAISMAKRNGASLFVIQVIPTTVVLESQIVTRASPEAWRQYADVAKKSAGKSVAEVVSRAKGEGLKVRGEVVENVESIVQGIIDYADEWKIDLIVVGTRGLSGLKKLVLGSVSSGLITHASSSVLVVR